MEPGYYYVGDLCYVFNDKDWSEICKLTFSDKSGIPKNGEFELSNGVKIAIYSTKYGDGIYDYLSGSIDVDSGSIGCVLIDSIEMEFLPRSYSLGKVINFDKPFETNSWETSSDLDDGVIKIGHILIETNPDMDDDDNNDE
jgi:hypothetical protein